MMMGCPGFVQIDETVLTRNKCNRGSRRPSAEQWVFDMYHLYRVTERMMLVSNWNAQTHKNDQAATTEVWTMSGPVTGIATHDESESLDTVSSTL